MKVTHTITVLRQLFLILTMSTAAKIGARVLRYSADYIIEMGYKVSVRRSY
jgi:hypothetical protein